jgi:hypothetical protein
MWQLCTRQMLVQDLLRLLKSQPGKRPVSGPTAICPPHVRQVSGEFDLFIHQH